jgi:anti-anti-sigma regulatory factor
MSDPSRGVENVSTPPTGPVVRAAARLRATITGDDHAVTVRLRGELSGLSVPLLESVLHRLEARGPALVVLDIRELTVIDRSGAGLVRRAKRRGRLAGRPLQLTSCPERLSSVPDVPEGASRVPSHRAEHMDAPRDGRPPGAPARLPSPPVPRNQSQAALRGEWPEGNREAEISARQHERLMQIACGRGAGGRRRCVDAATAIPMGDRHHAPGPPTAPPRPLTTWR